LLAVKVTKVFSERQWDFVGIQWSGHFGPAMNASISATVLGTQVSSSTPDSVISTLSSILTWQQKSDTSINVCYLGTMQIICTLLPQSSKVQDYPTLHRVIKWLNGTLTLPVSK